MMRRLGQSFLAAQAMYHAFTIEATIPFDYSDANAAVPFTDDVRTRVEIQSDDGTSSRVFHPIIDTGSCGFVVSAADLPGWSREEAAKHPAGWEFLSSSKILYAGHWISKDIFFTNAEVEIVARVPVLAVETRTHCPQYNATRDRDKCPAAKHGSLLGGAVQMPRGIQVLGVGFGREHDGMPQGTPDKNAFINVQRIGDKSVTDCPHFRNGYIVTREGITIGLTGANMRGMSFSKLNLRHTSVDSRDWAQAQGSMAVDGGDLVTGPALVDTGVSQMYMTLPLGTSVNRTHPPVLDDGSTVNIQVGRGECGEFIATETFTVGDEEEIENNVTPATVRLTLANPSKNPPHFNTGRHFLRAWDVAFDSEKGFFGLRQTNPVDEFRIKAPA